MLKTALSFCPFKANLVYEYKVNDIYGVRELGQFFGL